MSLKISMSTLGVPHSLKGMGRRGQEAEREE